METVLTTLGTTLLVGSVIGILYVFYKVLKYAFVTVKTNNDE